MPITADLLAAACGSLIGFSLALIGGGGSILATPMLLYIVGVRDPHVAIGTGALAVAVNAWANLVPHARAGRVQWHAAVIFAAAGVTGAFLGSTLGKSIDGQRLLGAFAVLMLVVAALMLRRADVPATPAGRGSPGKLVATGLGAGLLAGFFGIGGGFLVVPGLVFAGGLTMLQAVGSSLVAVGAFGFTTALNYAHSGWVDWRVAAVFIGGGVAGGWLGAALAGRLAARKGMLNRVFAVAISLVALYILWHVANGGHAA